MQQTKTKKKFFYGWVIVFCCTLLVAAGTGIFVNCLGIFVKPVCEELGFIGAVLIIVLFVLFIVQGLLIAYKAENLYCTMVGIGIMAQIAWQVFCNIAVVTNTLPNTGISLPFFSSGGTSLILLLAEMGVMVNIGRNGERVAQQREQMRAQREAARAEREAELARKTIDLASARAARTEQ